MRTFSVRLVLLIGLLACTSCDSNMPDNAACTGFLYPRCTITSGSYASFTIGMTKDAAFEAACRLENEHRWRGRPVFYDGDDPWFYKGNEGSPQHPVCSMRSVASVADMWALTEMRGTREWYVILYFKETSLVRIVLGGKGWDT